jgi:hypothetical protein
MRVDTMAVYIPNQKYGGLTDREKLLVRDAFNGGRAYQASLYATVSEIGGRDDYR